jgi:hypothetical protein
METRRRLVEWNVSEIPAVEAPFGLGNWFSFTYYAPPALLAGREAPMR